MKKYWWFGLVLCLGLQTAHAQDSSGLRITDFASDIIVRNDASIDVAETITAQFDTEHHGIFRTIPLDATFNDQKVSLPISAISVTQDGQTAIVKTSTNGKNEKIIKIGDPDVLILGSHVYVIRYHVAAAVNFFQDFDELNWNVTGNAWEVPIESAQATVHLPAPTVTPTALCYTGPRGSTAQACVAKAIAGQATFTANDTLTVVSHWPKGIVTQPSNYQQLRQVSSWQHWLTGLAWLVAALIPIVTAWFMYRRWSEQGRDPAESQTIIAQYEPPADIRPAEAQVILKESVTNRAISGTIVDLAVRGYLKIEEIDKAKFLGLGQSHDFALIRQKPTDTTLRDYEVSLLETLFDQPDIKDDQGRTLLSLMRRKQTKMYPKIKGVMTLITKGMTTRGWFAADPQKTRGKYAAVGLALIVLGYYVGIENFSSLPRLLALPLIGIGVAGAIIAAVGYFMPRRTEAGAKADWQLKGFKLYLTTAEKYRLQWQEKQNIFETFLPYALALGVAEKWAKTFADISLPPPSWYSGPAGTTWSSVYVWTSLSQFNSAFSAATIPSGGGSAGGGSGGGGGGGGGGGW